MTPDSIANLLDNLDTAMRSIVPTGMIMWWTAQSDDHVPAGWLKCDGETISSSGVTENLYNHLRAVGNPWGPGADSTTVRVPDLRGRFVRGFDDAAGRDPQNTAFGGSQGDSFKSHNHGANVTDPGHNHTYIGNQIKGANRTDKRTIIDDDWDKDKKHTDGVSSSKTGISVTVQNTGGNETKPKNLNLTPVIKL